MLSITDNCLQVSAHQLEAAFDWLCKQRQHYPDNADIWWFRAHWHQRKAELLPTINSGDYVLLPLEKYCKKMDSSFIFDRCLGAQNSNYWAT